MFVIGFDRSMNVLFEFNGDDDDRLAWLQHDCYFENWSSLRLIRSAVGNATGKDFGFKLDHRDFQRSHDLLAGAFRYEFKTGSSYEKSCVDVIFDNPIITKQRKSDVDIIVEWREFLSNTLVSQPILKRFERAFDHYSSENFSSLQFELERSIFVYFQNVPWVTQTKNTYGKI